MKSTVRAYLGLLTLSCCSVFVACGDDDDDGPGAAGQASEAGASSNGGTSSHPEGGTDNGGSGHGEAALECKVLGELCHAADSGSGPAHDCHEVGHEGHADACAAQFDGCVETCTEVDVGAAGAGSDAKCVALGSLCHEAGEIDAEAEACHEVGHVGNASDCAEQFDACATLCLAVLEQAEGNVGGSGAGGGASGGAGEANGGALNGAGGAP
jgi:hypothetical protein